MSGMEVNHLINLHKGDPNALRYYFDKYKDRLLYFANSLLKKYPGVAEEITSESFVKLWNKRTDFDHEDKLKAFLYIVTKNTCLTYLSSCQVQRHVDVEISEDALVTEPEVYVKLVRAELLDQLDREIEKLPSSQKKIVQLSYYDDVSAQDISEELGMTANAVYTNYSRAIARLRQTLFSKKDWLY